MAVTPAFRDYVLDLLAPLRPTQSACSAASASYSTVPCSPCLRATSSISAWTTPPVPASRPPAARPFGYNRAGRDVVIASYYAVPPDLYDQPEELLSWATQAAVAAQRNARRPKRKRA